ncbi:glycosyltransferase family 4 protein [Mycobacterium sp. MYCO198283]|uniref:glycosyltransferase family 4 protein n=1 Tax=Mycobacterium sp. MYCO198283 TaxID=2883505 RepID=UPI001E56A6DC|nr:glycosyltransferase family 4 protein [Mycobacterium sp. MYCO198283]MCG5434364.1 glycosyltransferase family 4 protein [Mycobacterium sp. MYCO198283]
MRVLLVSWEYPPVVIGGLGRHVHHLATELAAAGHDVCVLSRRPTGTDPATHPTTDTRREGVRVVAAAEDPHAFTFSDDLMAWTLAMGHAMVRAALAAAFRPDVVHAHDWLVAHPALTLAEFHGVPLVSTLHATEAGRHAGWISGAVSRQVHALESWLARSSDALIACSQSMRAEIADLFGPDLPRVTVIPNGIDVAGWPFALRRPRTGPARLLFVGRLEYEKGVHDAIAALAQVRRTHPGTTLTIAGAGTQRDWLVDKARKHKVHSSVRFVGQLDQPALLAALHSHDGAVLPSFYEPFGIVALEAAAAGCPLVVSDVGGLGEAVVHGHTGLCAPPKDIGALAAAIRELLDDPDAAQQRAVAARDRLTAEFAWPSVAQRTAEVYGSAKRLVREPLSRRPIPEQALPPRHGR